MYTMTQSSFFMFIIGIVFASPLQAAQSKPSNRQKHYSHEYMKNGVSISIQEMTPQESKEKLGNEFKRRNKAHAIIPLAVKVTNHSSRGINFSRDDINLKLASLQDVRIQAEFQARLYVAIGAGACIFAPFIFIAGIWCAILAAWAGWPLLVFEGILIGSLIVSMAPSVICGLQYRKEKKKIRDNITSPYETFGMNYIAPNETLTKVVYIKRKDLPQS
ncbi:hypothetical protein A3F06_03395 [candidate division TM6 bacterium RIFCSPHIGHO2_12_FULL_36_22]|nr:MAG: hypothetical protein A3F06_03395 [candidate division TM6 bacterium RIFCSPHIGHO2_12_FULL_36_22]